jgi:class 3 adenylate cyclase
MRALAFAKERPRFESLTLIRGADEHAAATLSRHGLRRERIAVLVGDVVGYSRLIERDDVDTVLRLRHLHRQLIAPAAASRGGHIVRLCGDSVLAAFADPVAAVGCGIAVQRALKDQNHGAARAVRLRLRIGISFDVVLIDHDGDLHGPAVNVAARLEALAGPGDIYLTGPVHERIAGPGGPHCTALGPRRLHNISEPVEVFRISRTELRGSPGHHRALIVAAAE